MRFSCLNTKHLVPDLKLPLQKTAGWSRLDTNSNFTSAMQIFSQIAKKVLCYKQVLHMPRSKQLNPTPAVEKVGPFPSKRLRNNFSLCSPLGTITENTGFPCSLVFCQLILFIYYCTLRSFVVRPNISKCKHCNT